MNPKVSRPFIADGKVSKTPQINNIAGKKNSPHKAVLSATINSKEPAQNI
ncbi:conserved hypothetical protein [delta proteobacterium NaphS2]|nr:conserved hypothetical protein [delta proteobacterium NaphS2]